MCVAFISLFFFFKQKTAYEMRISDWSSDVCSSDLRRRDADNVEPGGACLGPDAVDDGFHGENSRSICFWRSEEHTSELQSLMRISYAVFCLKKKKRKSK